MRRHGRAVCVAAAILAPFALVACIVACLVCAPSAFADEATDLQNKISARNADIQALEKEIAGYQTQISSLSSQESSLADTIKSLDLTDKKLQVDIRVTEDKIDATNLRIQQLTSQIGTTQGTIDDNKRFIMASFKAMEESGSKTVPAIILSSQSISDAWQTVAHLGIIESGLEAHIRDLNASKSRLESNRAATESARADLVTLGNQLHDQEKAILSTRAEKKDLLSQTKNSEASYKQILAQKQALRDAFQQELLDFESQLKLVVNKANLPKTGTGALQWPLSHVIITQYFGNTPFSTANPQIYSGHGHDGIDLGASIGTPVMAARGGKVVGVANTDIVPGCYSFGKWIMIQHDDGLSTLYAHLSVQSVSPGQNVETGQVIGYTGNTGYTTGPHLHFGVYATDGTEIKLFTNSLHCQGATIPIAVLSAYLNPLSYLPALPQ